MIGVWMFHTGIGVRLRHMGIKVPLRRTRIGVGLHQTGIRVRLFHMVGMVRFCGAVFPYGFEGAPVRILGMVPGPGLSCGLSYAVGIRKPFQVINILPLSPGDNWDGFRRGAANTAPWDASGLFLLYWAMDVSCGKRLGKGVVFFLHLDFQGGGNKGHTGGRAANARAMFPGKGKEGYAQIVDKAC